MKELSIFVDESGDFGPASKHSPYYLITLVFHDQAIDISSSIQKLDSEIARFGLYHHAIHTEPLIRREEDYSNLSPNERRAIFTKLFFFAKKCEIQYKTFVFAKKEYSNVFLLEAAMARELSRFIRNNLNFFQSFDRIVLYYDNGQHELNRILNAVLATELSHYELKKVVPSDYKLFQVADLFCTLELINEKLQHSEMNHSEELLFHSKRDFRKDFMDAIIKKRF